MRAHVVKLLLILFDNGCNLEFQLCNFDSRVIELHFMVLALDDFFFEFFVELFAIFLGSFLKVEDLLLFKGKLILVVLFQGGDVGMPKVCHLDFEGFGLVFVGLSKF